MAECGEGHGEDSGVPSGGRETGVPELTWCASLTPVLNNPQLQDDEDMSVPYICSACRLAPLTRTVRGTARHLRTLSQAIASNGTREDGDGDHHGIGDGDGSGSGIGHTVRGRYSGRELRPEQLYTPFPHPPPEPPRSRLVGTGSTQRANRPAPQRPHQTDDHANDNAFAIPTHTMNVVNELSGYSTAEDWPSTWRVLQKLARIYSEGNPRHAARFLNISGVSRIVSILLHRSIINLMDSIRTGDVDSAMPTPYSIMLLLHQAYVSKTLYVRPVLSRLSDYLWTYQAGRRADIHDQRLSNGVNELMGIWRLCIGGSLSSKSLGDVREAKARAFTSVATSEEDWSFLPAVAAFTSLHERDSSTAFEQMLGLLVPPTDVKQGFPARGDYASAALLTVDLLNKTVQPSEDGQNVPMATLARYAPFAEIIAEMLGIAASPRVPPELELKLALKADELGLEQLKAMLARVGCEGYSANVTSVARNSQTPARSPPSVRVGIPARVENPTSFDGTEQLSPEVKAAGRPAVESYAREKIYRLLKAMEGQGVAQVAKIVREVQEYASTLSHGEVLPIDLYEHMLLASLSVRDTKTAVEVWQKMAQLGLEPTVKTYTVMMRGSQNARDVKGMEAFFQRMRQAGLRPDAYSWSIRIFGLLKLRNVSTGMRALSEMGQEWFAAAKAKAVSEGLPADTNWMASNKNMVSELMKRYPGPVDGVPRPNLEVMNAAMAALATTRPDEVPKVFSWGRSFGIEPNLATFNTLLSISMKQHRPTDALEVLQQMQERGLEADSTTWTVIVTSLFEGGFLEGLSPSAQQTKILNFIDALSDKSEKLPGINSMGYALIIDRLIKHYQNHTAAAAVYSHMLSRGLKPTTHIYTILMGSYFDREHLQPDFAAIEALWQQIAHSELLTGIDGIFYDRMIEWYARYHHLVGVQPMEKFLTLSRASSKKPGWKALESVARVYAARHMWDKMRNLVDAATIDMRDQQGRISKTGERQFWDFVHSTGLLRQEGYLSRDDFNRDRPVGSPLERAERAVQSG